MPYLDPHCKKARESAKRRQDKYKASHREILRERGRAYYLAHSEYIRYERRVRQFKKLLG